MTPSVSFDLESFQSLLSRLIFTPLIEKNHSLVTDVTEFQRILKQESKKDHYSLLGIETYSRNFWYKHLSNLQSSLPLFANFLGLWEFNKFALKHFSDETSSVRDLGHIPESFFNELKKHIDLNFKSERHLLLEQSLNLDLAWHELFRVQSIESERLEIVPSENTVFKLKDKFRILQDSFGLWDLRVEIKSILDHGRSPHEDLKISQKAPAKRSSTSYILMKSQGPTVDWILLDALRGDFLSQLNGNSLAQAVDNFNAQLTPDERILAERNIHSWVRSSLEQNLWDFVV